MCMSDRYILFFLFFIAEDDIISKSSLLTLIGSLPLFLSQDWSEAWPKVVKGRKNSVICQSVYTAIVHSGILREYDADSLEAI